MMNYRLASAIVCLCLPTFSLADDIRGVFGFELSRKISNYEGLQLMGTSEQGPAAPNGEKWRLEQVREPLRRHYRVEFENIPSAFPISNEGVVSTYEDWIATIIAKSDSFDSYSKCQDEQKKFEKILRKEHGEPQVFQKASWWAQNKRFPRYKHHNLVGISRIWEAENSILLIGCQTDKSGETRFSFIYESALWQRAVANWRTLMDERRRLEKEISQPNL